MRRLVVILSLFLGLGCAASPVSGEPAKTLEQLVKDQVKKSVAKSSLVGIAVIGHKGKLRVLISIFGRATPVELEFVQVEKA